MQERSHLQIIRWLFAGCRNELELWLRCSPQQGMLSSRVSDLHVPERIDATKTPCNCMWKEMSALRACVDRGNDLKVYADFSFEPRTHAVSGRFKGWSIDIATLLSNVKVVKRGMDLYVAHLSLMKGHVLMDRYLQEGGCATTMAMATRALNNCADALYVNTFCNGGAIDESDQRLLLSCVVRMESVARNVRSIVRDSYVASMEREEKGNPFLFDAEREEAIEKVSNQDGVGSGIFSEAHKGHDRQLMQRLMSELHDAVRMAPAPPGVNKRKSPPPEQEAVSNPHIIYISDDDTSNPVKKPAVRKAVRKAGHKAVRKAVVVGDHRKPAMRRK